MATSKRALPTLQLVDPRLLLEQLRAGGRNAELKEMVDWRYPHCTVLRNYRYQSAETRKFAFECCKLMVESKAPVDSSRYSLISMFITYDWNEETPELNRELAQLYLDHGYVDPNKVEPGNLAHNSSRIRTALGMSPLAAAITYDHLETLELLYAAGAQDDIGIVAPGGCPRQADEYAQEMGATRCISYFNARAMRGVITNQAAPVAAHTTAHSPRRRAGL